MLLSFQTSKLPEAGCDEAGRGCLAGPVFAAAVILPPHFAHPLLRDSKQLTEKQRLTLKAYIEENAVAYAVAQATPDEIDQINILQASLLAMHRALDRLTVRPRFIIVDGNKFNRYRDIPHACIIGGDAQYASIATASILAKTYRDAYMREAATRYPQYDWHANKGYPTARHREAIRRHGPSPLHRQSFTLLKE